MNRNLKDALSTRSGAYRITRTHSRIFVDLPDGGFPEAVQRLSRIFGVQSLAQVEEREWRDLNDLVTAGVEIFEGAPILDRIVRARLLLREGELGLFSARDFARAPGAG